MEQTQYNYAPGDPKGREFMGEGYTWVIIISDGKITYGKVDKDGFTNALSKLPFELWHPLGMTPKGLDYTAASSRTVEPWIMVTCTAIAIVHPEEATNLDKLVKDLVSKITIYKENQVPKVQIGPQGIIRE